MIHLEELTIHQFRGIRHLTIDLGRKNFAVCGQNGTGKSGVVDAIEFVLTGTISRLTGKGRGDLSIPKHAPHVDSTPEEAYVACALWAPALNRRITIKRTVKRTRAPELTPDIPIVHDLLGRLEGHSEIALSRRQIIQYVLTEPGQRAKDIQALLKLDDLEATRATLQKIANAEEGAAQSAERARLSAADALMRAMAIKEPCSTEILNAANQRRKILSLEPLADLANVRDGIATRQASGAEPSVNKAAATADVAAAMQNLAHRRSDEWARQTGEALRSLRALQADAALLKAVEREDLLATALDLYDGEACPVCDTAFRPEEFAAIIDAKRARLSDVKRRRAEAEARLAPVASQLETEVAALRSVYPNVKRLIGDDGAEIVQQNGQEIKAALTQIAALLPLEATLTALAALREEFGAAAVVERLQGEIAALPEPSEQEAASVYLTIAQERLTALRSATNAQRAAQARARTARRTFEVYAATTTNALEKICQEVEANFSELYRQLNADDESTFLGRLTPSIGKLGFNVDFYNRGFFPPGAFHSEGHQDSMGLCLYLALMKYLLGNDFTVAVLDDVLMSVDAGHRREVSRMLKSQFPNTQFVLTTHDKTWLKQLTHAGLVEGKRVIHFQKWTVDDGPSAWGDQDVWEEIEAHIAGDDIRAAAALLRNTLEHVMAEQCHALRAKVEFSIDGRHDLGDLLDPAMNRFQKLLEEAIAAAESWGDAARAAKLRLRRDAFAQAAKAALGEQWQLNPAIHFNEWANFHPHDFHPLAKAFRALVAQFLCATCGAPLEITPIRGNKEHLQCGCGTESHPFKKKPKEKTAASAASPRRQGSLLPRGGGWEKHRGNLDSFFCLERARMAAFDHSRFRSRPTAFGQIATCCFARPFRSFSFEIDHTRNQPFLVTPRQATAISTW